MWAQGFILGIRLWSAPAGMTMKETLLPNRSALGRGPSWKLRRSERLMVRLPVFELNYPSNSFSRRASPSGWSARRDAE